MSRICLSILKDDSNEVESFYELDTDWISDFNEGFKTLDIPNKEQIYQTELISFLAKSMIDEFIQSEEDKQFKVNTIPLEAILTELLFNTTK
jgi:Ca2+-binding EF-hand superfamily protein